MYRTYTVYVYTGNPQNAGTNSNVHIELFGKKQSSGTEQNSGTEQSTGKIYLKHSKTHQDKFERDNMDEFDIIAQDIGDLTKIK